MLFVRSACRLISSPSRHLRLPRSNPDNKSLICDTRSFHFSSLQSSAQSHENHPHRLSNFWAPTGGIAHGDEDDSHSLLVRGGFIRQAHSGLFQFLPMGLRIQEKLERLIDKHMLHIGASKVSLSTFSSEDLWKKSGRLGKGSSELFHIHDRRGTKYLLSPTHEEEITSLVGNAVHSYRDLPLRLYQITRKYRDEPRPRQGLLRTREFLMKDLYTFDASEQEALQTYQIVRDAYKAFFDELKIPYLTARAHSGDIGGDLSHEYHFPSAKGEDVILSCSRCAYLKNEELELDSSLQMHDSAFRIAMYRDRERRVAEGRPFREEGVDEEGEYNVRPGDVYDENVVTQGFKIWHGVSADRSLLVEAVIPQAMKIENRSGSISHWRETDFCTNSIKRIYPDIDLSVERPVEIFEQHASCRNTAIDADAQPTKSSAVRYWVDDRVSQQALERWEKSPESVIPKLDDDVYVEGTGVVTGGIIKIAAGDPCPECGEGAVRKTKAIELGHTFHLGTRYSKPLDACFSPSPSQRTREAMTTTAQTSQRIPMQMGCHGIGISRMIAAVADNLADSKGLNWPRVMAPFEVVIINRDEHQDQVPIVCNLLNAATRKPALASNEPMDAPLDIVVDDRKQGFVWKLNDADLIGYPIIIILGKRYGKERICEIQCRRLGVKEDVHIDELNGEVRGLLEQL